MRNSVRNFWNLQRAGNRCCILFPNESELSSVCDRLYELAEGKVSWQHIQAAFPVFLHFCFPDTLTAIYLTQI